jgi:NitT/TauT family transport system substrate-binding protein
MKKSVIIIMALLGSTLASAAKIKVGSSPVLSSAGIYLALENGYFKDQGLEVEVFSISNSGAPMTLLLSKGELQVGAGNLSSGLFNAILSGEKFKLVADKGHIEKGRDYIQLLVRKDLIDSGKYKTLKDLKGYKLGLTALDGVSQQILVDRFLQKGGLSEKDVEYVKLSYAEMNTALKTKAIDATIQLEPYLSKAQLDGIAKAVASAIDVHPRQQSAALFFSPQFANEDKETAVRFLMAYIKGVRFYNRAIRDKKFWPVVEASLKKHIDIGDSAVWSKMVPIGLSDNGEIDLTALRDDLKWYQKKGYLKGTVSLEQTVDSRLVREAVQRLKKK